MVKKTTNSANVNNDLVLKYYKDILELMEQKTSQTEITRGFKEALKISYFLDAYDIDDNGNQPVKGWAAELIKHRTLKETTAVDEKLPDLKRIFEPGSAPYKDVIQRVAKQTPVHLFFDIDKKEFFWLDDYKYQDLTFQNNINGKSNTWKIASIYKDDLPFKRDKLKSKNSVKMFSFLFGDNIVSDEEIFEIFFNKRIKDQLESFVKDFALEVEDEETVFAKVRYGFIPAKFVNKFILERQMRLFISTKSQERERLFEMIDEDKIVLDEFKNKYLKEAFCKILDVNILLKLLKPSGGADYIRKLALKNFIKGFSDIDQEEQQKLQVEWIRLGYSRDVDPDFLENLISTEATVEEIVCFFKRMFPGQPDNPSRFKSFHLGVGFTDELKTKVRKSLLTEMKQISEITVPLSVFLYFKNEDYKYKNTNPNPGLEICYSTLELMINVQDWIKWEDVFPQKINVILDDNLKSIYNIDGKGSNYYAEPLSKLFVDIKDVILKDYHFKNSKFTFIDGSGDDLFLKISKNFEHYLGDIKILPHQEMKFLDESTKCTLSNDSSFKITYRSYLNRFSN